MCGESRILGMVCIIFLIAYDDGRLSLVGVALFFFGL